MFHDIVLVKVDPKNQDFTPEKVAESIPELKGSLCLCKSGHLSTEQALLATIISLHRKSVTLRDLLDGIAGKCCRSVQVDISVYLDEEKQNGKEQGD